MPTCHRKEKKKREEREGERGRETSVIPTRNTYTTSRLVLKVEYKVYCSTDHLGGGDPLPFIWAIHLVGPKWVD